MNRAELQSMIDTITEDIRKYQELHGSLIVFDPNSEAYKLSETKVKLMLQLQYK